MTDRTMTEPNRRYTFGRWTAELIGGALHLASGGRVLLMSDEAVAALDLPNVASVVELAALIESLIPAPAVAKPPVSHPARELRWVDAGGGTTPRKPLTP